MFPSTSTSHKIPEPVYIFCKYVIGFLWHNCRMMVIKVKLAILEMLLLRNLQNRKKLDYCRLLLMHSNPYTNLLFTTNSLYLLTLPIILLSITLGTSFHQLVAKSLSQPSPSLNLYCLILLSLDGMQIHTDPYQVNLSILIGLSNSALTSMCTFWWREALLGFITNHCSASSSLPRCNYILAIALWSLSVLQPA